MGNFPAGGNAGDYEYAEAQELRVDSGKLDEANGLLRKINKKGGFDILGILWYLSCPFLGGYAFLTLTSKGLNFNVIAAALLLITPGFFILKRGKNRINRFYKKLLPGILSEAFKEYNPEPMKIPSKDFFEMTGLERGPESCIVIHPQTDIGPGEMYFYIERIYHDGDEDTNSYYTINQGAVLNVKPNNNFSYPCRLFIESEHGINYDKILRLVPFANSRISHAKGKMQKIQLEDPVFERDFVVRSDDPLFSRKLLTPVKMEEFTSFQNQYGRFLYYYNGEKIIISFPGLSLIDASGCHSQGVPDSISAETLLSCKRKVNSIIKDLRLIWG